MKKLFLSTILFLSACGTDTTERFKREPEPEYTCEDIYKGCSLDARYASSIYSYYGRLGHCQDDYIECEDLKYKAEHPETDLDAGTTD